MTNAVRVATFRAVVEVRRRAWARGRVRVALTTLRSGWVWWLRLRIWVDGAHEMAPGRNRQLRIWEG